MISTWQYTCTCINFLLICLSTGPKTPIYLVNGSNSYSGRVEIEYKKSNGTICDKDFGENDAKVVCRMLGYSPL